MTKQIPLTQGKVALVSDHRFVYLMQWVWHAHFDGKKWYAQRTEKKWGFQKTIKMHRQIMGVTDPNIHTDHIDNDGLNNVDDNLRKCTNQQNQQNRGKSKLNKTGFKGVSRKKNREVYVAQIHADGKVHHLGYFINPIEAAKAYDEAAKKHFGEFAWTNF